MLLVLEIAYTIYMYEVTIRIGNAHKDTAESKNSTQTTE